ncbi:MAG TPA: 3-oxoacyl-ACP reductase family protein [Dehalococcoidia bacterium]|nr:3-oxoacyl-ACP reductase family protein [Dehalococcoidia bacterium]
MRCKGKVALVTGGSRGIGRAICLRLAEEGAVVAVNYPDPSEPAQEVVDAIRAGGGTALAVQADVGAKAEIDRMVAAVLAAFGRIDVLVNNAGICPFAAPLEITEELWDRTQDVDLKGVFFCSQAVARSMVEGGIHGSVVSISSINTYVGGSMQAHYGPAKAGVWNLMKALAVGFAPHGIRFNSVLPGTILTDINRAFFQDRDALARYVARIPAGRLGDPREVANAVLFFASDESSYVNGAELLVDGGALVNFA